MNLQPFSRSNSSCVKINLESTNQNTMLFPPSQNTGPTAYKCAGFRVEVCLTSLHVLGGSGKGYDRVLRYLGSALEIWGGRLIATGGTFTVM